MRFETQADLDREDAVIHRICRGKPYIKLGEHDLDFCIVNTAYIEIKNFTVSSDKYPIQIVSCIKLVKMQERNKILPTYFFAQFTDKLMFIHVDDIQGYCKIGGRKPRAGSTNDQEFIVNVPKTKFKEFKD
jgi:hypothetical protein